MIRLLPDHGARFWLRVMTELKNRGIADVLIAVVDGLGGFPDAILAVFPDATIQTCMVHPLRHSLDLFVGLTRSHRDHGPFSPCKHRKAVAAAPFPATSVAYCPPPMPSRP